MDSYEKKYKEALERARKLKENPQGVFYEYSPDEGDTICDYIFPELKENKDEKIRKALIEYFNEQCDMSDWNGVYGYQVVAWLEKQDESAETKAKTFLINKGYPIDTNGIFPTYEEMYNIIKEGLEKQGEQKSVDKVEPKFKVGDWVIIDGETLHIINVTEDGYSTEEGGHIPFRCEKDARLWSIQEAKSGDVLATGNKNIFIFKSISNYTIYDYCGLYFGKIMARSGAANGEAAVQLPTDYVPATKEQCDTLIKAMADAGYTFDFKKKELKKIEQKSVEDSCKNSDDITTEEIDITEYKKGFECGKQRVLKYPEDFGLCKKSAWSEEDEKMLNDILMCGEHHCYLDAGNIAWLKSIKNRVQPKQEWGEEDNEMLNSIIEEVRYIGDFPDYPTKEENELYDECLAKVEWLKSLRPQWKPTEDQIMCLQDAISDYHRRGYKAEVLETLLKQLKQL